MLKILKKNLSPLKKLNHKAERVNIRIFDKNICIFW